MRHFYPYGHYTKHPIRGNLTESRELEEFRLNRGIVECDLSMGVFENKYIILCFPPLSEVFYSRGLVLEYKS